MQVSQLKLNPDNPRTITDAKFKKLVASIRDFPKMMELRPLVIDDTNTIIGGNMRLNAIKELGMTDIPDNWVKQASELTAKERERFIIADNMPYGAWDFDKLANSFEMGDLINFGFEEWEFGITDESGDNQENGANTGQKSDTITCPKCGHKFEPE